MMDSEAPLISILCRLFRLLADFCVRSLMRFCEYWLDWVTLFEKPPERLRPMAPTMEPEPSTCQLVVVVFERATFTVSVSWVVASVDSSDSLDSMAERSSVVRWDVFIS